MLATTVKKAVLILALLSVVPFAACSDDDDTPTAPTQPGPPVSETPPPTTPPTDPTPTPPPTDDRPVVTITGTVANLDRSGAGDLDIMFRIDDFTEVRAPGRDAGDRRLAELQHRRRPQRSDGHGRGTADQRLPRRDEDRHHRAGAVVSAPRRARAWRAAARARSGAPGIGRR